MAGHPTPRLMKCMQWVAILSPGEAEAAVRDYRAGFQYSSEAVNHFGGGTIVILRAIQCRHIVQRLRYLDRVENSRA